MFLLETIQHLAGEMEITCMRQSCTGGIRDIYQ